MLAEDGRVAVLACGGQAALAVRVQAGAAGKRRGGGGCHRGNCDGRETLRFGENTVGSEKELRGERSGGAEPCVSAVGKGGERRVGCSLLLKNPQQLHQRVVHAWIQDSSEIVNAREGNVKHMDRASGSIAF